MRHLFIIALLVCSSGCLTRAHAPQLVTAPSSAATVTVRAVFHAGSSDDDASMQGITALSADLLRHGEESPVDQVLFALGASIEVQVGRDQTVFTGRAHQNVAPRFLEIFSELLTHSLSSERSFNQRRAHALAKLNRLQAGSVEELGKELLQSVIYRAHPYAHPSVGTVSGLEAITLKALQSHRKQVLCSERLTLGLSGQIDRETLNAFMESLTALNSDTCSPHGALPTPQTTQAPHLTLYESALAGAASIHLGLPLSINRSHADFPALLLASAYLGQHRQFNGALMKRVRVERGLNYGSYAYAEHFQQDGESRFPLPNTSRRQQYFSLWLRPTRTQNAHFATTLAARTYESLVEQGLSKEDFDALKQFALHYYPLYLQSQSRQLGFALDDIFYGHSEPMMKRIRAVWEGMDVETFNATIERQLRGRSLQIAILTDSPNVIRQAFLSGELESPHYPMTVAEHVLVEDASLRERPLTLGPDHITIRDVPSVFH